MSIFDPNHVSAAFAAATDGYLKADVVDLTAMRLRMPGAVTVRERAIAAAIKWMLNHPERWTAMVEPYVFEKRPVLETPRGKK